MADINHIHFASETEEMVDLAETVITHTNSSNHLEDQISNMNHNEVGNQNESEMVEIAENHVQHETPTTPFSISSNQPNGQIKVDEVLVEIEAMLLDREEPPLSTACCIYRVPHVIRELNAEAYTPKIVSIGPFHYGNPRLQHMKRHKQIFFKKFIEQAEPSLDDLVSFVISSEPRVSACYSENIKLSKKELVKVILVDAGFIIELFRKYYKEDLLADDPNLSKPWLTNNLMLDLFVLENQLPFFILEELFVRAFPSHNCNDQPSFLELTFDFFSSCNIQNLKPNSSVRIKHFTDLLRIFHLQRKEPHSQSFEDPGNHVRTYSANELQEAGVKFKANTEKCLLNFKFLGRVLEMPQILVHDRTETIFRNIIALEQCHHPYESYITNYALVLDCLINTSKDVDVPVHQEIISHYLPDSNDVAKLFNGLCKEIVYSTFNSDYYSICKRLNAFCRNPWNRKKATLRSDYCKTPWQTAASLAAILLIILTLVQTICSVIQVVQ